MTSDEKIKKWLSGDLSDSERKEFEGSSEFEKISRLLEASKHFKAPEYDVQNEYKRLAVNVLGHGRTVSFYKRISPILKVAAIFIVALSAGYFLYHNIFNDANKQEWISAQTEIYLPDSSFVSLNTASSIRYSEAKWEQDRYIELAGEAFFKVRPGIQFNVKTTRGNVSVLGTSFSVKDRDEYFEVSCYSGSVKVTTSRKSVVLKPNMTYTELPGKTHMYAFSDQPVPTWLKGESNFRSIPLKFVFDELERQFQVTIATKNVDTNQLFTGSFSNENLEIALKAVTIPVNLQYEILENKIEITVEGK